MIIIIPVGIRVSGSIVYTDDATGFGGVSAQIDGDDTTLNITAGKTSGVAKIERGTSANITDINHANVSNNTTIHIALKNTSPNKGDFITIGTAGVGGTYGGGAGGCEDDTNRPGSAGGAGGVRIIWGSGRSYPSTGTADV